jgi:polar amino acid transport system substrate-binding protein
MKKYIIPALLGFTLLLVGCKDEKDDGVIKFATSADYPPFEYYANGQITGFDIELAELIGEKLGKKVVFENMQFSSIFAALESNNVDAAISTITATKERAKAFDFSIPYYVESLAAVFPKDKPITNKSALSGKKIACQLGTTMEIWLKEHASDATIVSIDDNNQAIEALKAGHVDGVLMDHIQGIAFSHNNANLSYAEIAKSDTGYSIAFKKSSALKNDIDEALKSLESSGELEKLKQKWFEEGQWKN